MYATISDQQSEGFFCIAITHVDYLAITGSGEFVEFLDEQMRGKFEVKVPDGAGRFICGRQSLNLQTIVRVSHVENSIRVIAGGGGIARFLLCQIGISRWAAL